MERERGTAPVVCPTCGEPYGTPEKLQKLLINVAHCVNLTCLTDLSTQPIESILQKYQPRRVQFAAGNAKAVLGR